MSDNDKRPLAGRPDPRRTFGKDNDGTKTVNPVGSQGKNPKK